MGSRGVRRSFEGWGRCVGLGEAAELGVSRVVLGYLV